MKDSVKARGLPVFARLTASMPLPAHYAGTLPVAKLPRLAEAIAASEGDLTVGLDLFRDGRGPLRLAGSLRGTLRLVCQRCLKPFLWTLDAPIALCLVFSEDEEARVLHDEEPYRVEDERLPLHELVEDEALLALPFAPRCADPDCSAD
jgi:uncharacterized protein